MFSLPASGGGGGGAEEGEGQQMQAEGSCTVGQCPLSALLLVLQGAVLGRYFAICDGWNRGEQGLSLQSPSLQPWRRDELGKDRDLPGKGGIIPLRLCWGWMCVCTDKGEPGCRAVPKKGPLVDLD